MRFHAEEVTRIAASAIRGERVETRRRSLVPWAPNVPGEHAWAVVAKDGMPEVKAHDVFDAAHWFVRLESGDVLEPLPEGGLAIRTATEAVTEDDEVRRAELACEPLTVMIDMRREREGRA